MQIAAIRRLLCRAALVLVVFAGPRSIARAQESASQRRSVTSLGDSLKRAQFKQIHIFYVHGMAAAGPGYSESKLLRKSICQQLKDCTSPEGQFDGREYADQHDFILDSPPPNLFYFGEQIWKSRITGPPSEGWNASAPFVDHWKFVREGSAQTIYLDEINWWPLVFAVKCREIIAKDADLVGPSPSFLNKCSHLEPDPKIPGRFVSYPWIEEDDARQLRGLPSRGALANRSAKNAVLDWGFTDAVLAVGSMRSYLLEGIRQLVLKSANVAPDGGRTGMIGPLPNQEFVIVTHSLGSYLIFSALDLPDLPPSQPKPPPAEDWKLRFEKVLAQTSSVYFLANQVRLLELANLDVSPAQNMVKDLESWGRLRRKYQSELAEPTPNDLLPPQIVAWSDPSDLLTWSVPDLSTVLVKNLTVKNATHWFWLIENPSAAHANYVTDHRIITTMLKPSKPPQ
jgi:hypothetical protein